MCNESKSLDDFHNAKANKDGKVTRCKPCVKQLNLEWQAKNPEKARSAWRTAEAKSRDNLQSRARKYGLTKQELQVLIDQADGKCEICGRKPFRWLVVDHCHNTQIVRGMLCEGCNQAIGLFQEDTDSMQSAIEYLIRNKIERGTSNEQA
jgi:hypothetical protein